MYCGRFLAPAKWVASPPGGRQAAVTRPGRRYSGPPRYGQTPRWGFRPGPWNWPQPESTVPGGDPAAAATALTKTLLPLLWTVLVLAALAAGAETWRYVLLLSSRSDALPAGAVAASDALTLGAGIVAPIAAAGAGVLLVMWSVRASVAAAQRAGLRPSRSPREIVLGWLVPGLNLTVPGSVLAEIEHGLLGRPAAQRPRPSRLLVLWWLLWAVSVVLAVITLGWTFREGVQARADGVVLHALLDLVAAASAGVTAVVVRRLTTLLRVVEKPHRMLLVRIVQPADKQQPSAGQEREPANAGSPTAPADRA